MAELGCLFGIGLHGWMAVNVICLVVVAEEGGGTGGRARLERDMECWRMIWLSSVL